MFILNLIPRLRWKISLIFGLVAVFGVLVASASTYYQAEREFRKGLGQKLKSAARTVRDFVDPEKLRALRSIEEPYYIELKHFLQNLRKNLDVSWIGLYRHNGEFFTAIVDGAETGEGFTLDLPVFDTTPELEEAWQSGKAAETENYVDAYGEWKSYFLPVKNASDEVVAVIDVSESNFSLGRFTNMIIQKTIWVIILVTAFTLIVCISFSWTISRPLITLEEGARKLAAGDLQARVPPSGSRDEVGTLINTFNQMAEQLMASQEALSRKIFELSTLFEVSQKVNFAKNTRELLKLILEKSIDSIHASRGSVLLYSEEAEALVLDVVVGEGSENAKPGIQLKSGEGVAGMVFQEMKPIFINEGIERYFKPYCDGTTHNVVNILCVPLVIENRAIGVINLVNKKTGNITEADVNLMMTMASQVALTIEKSRLYELSITDGLTGLYIHRYFQIMLDRELKRAARYGNPLSLILFDIDHFKKFNDTWGHQQGDIVLSITATIVKKSLRENDFAARYGGEEFAIILPETDARGAFEVAERLRKSVEAFDYPGQDVPLKVTISLGIAQYPVNALVKAELIRKADEALYESKKSGRNRATVSKDKASEHSILKEEKKEPGEPVFGDSN